MGAGERLAVSLRLISRRRLFHHCLNSMPPSPLWARGKIHSARTPFGIDGWTENLGIMPDYPLKRNSPKAKKYGRRL